MGQRSHIRGWDSPHRRRQRRDGLVIYHGRPEGGISDLFWTLGMGFKSFYRYRSELAPAYWWTGAILAGAWLHNSHPGWWTVPIVAATAGLVAIVWRPAWLLRRWPLLARWRVRLWAAVFLPCVAATTAIATVYGPTAGELPTYSALAGFLLAVPWWWREDRRRLTRVRIIREHFPDTADAAGLSGARMVSAVLDKWGWTARIKLRRGQHWTDAVNALPRLESALSAMNGALRVEPVNDDAGSLMLRMIETDPHAEPIEWVPRPGKRNASIKQPLTVGVFEDGSDVSVSFLRKHVLIGGATDSGKSGLLNVILARLAECGDVAMWGVDLKEGMELAPWSRVLDRPVATNNDTAEQLLAAAVDELEKRANFLMGSGRREWHPKFDAPALFIIIDEYAELSKRAQKLADSIARRGRALCVNLIIATQRPTQKAMGEGSAIRSQMNIRFCLRVNERPDVDLILGAGKLTAGWDTTMFDGPGKFLVFGPGLATPRRGRTFRITDGEVRVTAELHARHADTAPAGRSHSRSDGRSGLQEPSGSPSGVSGPEMALWDALDAAPADGVSVADLRAATGQSKPSLYRRLSAFRAAGQAVQVSHGRWRSTRLDPAGPADDPATPDEPGGESESHCE